MDKLRMAGLGIVLTLLSACGQGSQTGSSSPATNISTSSGLNLYSQSTGTIYVGSTVAFYATGGNGVYTYAVNSGGGSINPSTGIYTATSTGTVVVGVQDTIGNSATYGFTVYSSAGSTTGTTTGTTTTTSTGLPISLSMTSGSTVYVNGSATFTASGGTGVSYFYSIQSGYGTINSSTGQFVAGSVAGSVTIKVQDSAGNSTTYSLTVYSGTSTTGTTTGSCVSASSSSVAYDGLVDIFADMAAYSQLNPYVIHALGVSIYGQHASGIYLNAPRLNIDGTLNQSDTYSVRTGNVTTTDGTVGQIYVQLPDNYIMYGFGVGAQSGGWDTEVVKLYGALWDSNGNVKNTVQCYADLYGNATCGSSVSIPSSYYYRYREYVGPANRAIRGVGIRVIDSSVTDLWVRNATMSSGCLN